MLLHYLEKCLVLAFRFFMKSSPVNLMQIEQIIFCVILIAVVQNMENMIFQDSFRYSQPNKMIMEL